MKILARLSNLASDSIEPNFALNASHSERIVVAVIAFCVIPVEDVVSSLLQE